MSMSSTLCFSVAETLRCAGLTRQESVQLLIPALIEGAIGLPLLYFKRRNGKIYWLFFAEGLFYALLALMDLFAHTRASGVAQMQLFKSMDIAVGALSIIPTLCYTFFLYLFAKRNLLPLLSSSWNTLISRTLLVLIPLMVTLNTVSSFLGISYTPVQMRDGHVTLGVGFLNIAARMPWMIVSNLSLVVATVYQAIHFCLAFLHFFQRANRPDRSSVTSEHDPRLYSRRGTGWLAVGLKLGAIEAVVGFAGFAYAPSLTRRYLRTVGRTFMVAGVCVSQDVDRDDVEGFTTFDENGDEKKERPRPRKTGQDLRAMISGPQLHTFRHFGSGGDSRERSLYDDAGISEAGIPGHSTASTPNPRVTVHFDAEKTPRLEMRFSDFAVPTPQPRNSATSSNLAEYTGFAPTVPIIQAPPPARRRANTVTTITSEQDGLFQDVGRLVTQLPTTPTERRIPTRSQTMTAATAASTYSQATEITTAGLDLQRKLSKRKAAPIASPATLSVASPWSGQMPVSRLRVRTDSTVLIGDTYDSAKQSGFVVVSPYLQDDGTVDYEPPSPSSGLSRSSSSRSRSTDSASLFTVPPVRSFDLRSMTPGTATTGVTGRGLARGPFAAPSFDERHSQSSATLLEQSGALSTPTIILSADGDAVYKHRPEFGFSVVEEELEDETDRASVLPGGRRRGTPDMPTSVSYESDSAEASSMRRTSHDSEAAMTTPARPTAVLRMKTVAVRETTPAVRAGGHGLAASLSAESALSPFADPFEYDNVGTKSGADLLRSDSTDSGVLSAVDRAYVGASLVRGQRQANANPFA